MITDALLDRQYFESLKTRILGLIGKGEHLFIGFAAEQSQFVRLNSAKVRQIGTVEDATLQLSLVVRGDGGALRKAQRSFTLTGISYEDWENTQQLLKALREEVMQLPVDPYAQLPEDHGSSSIDKKGQLLDIRDATDALIEPVRGADIAGIFASGRMVRAMANSAGLMHWFSTDTFSLDYSLYTPSQRALKGTYAGSEWDPAAYRAEMKSARHKLEMLERPAIKVERGAYRTYLAPAAYGDLVQMLSWGAVSEASIRQGDSPLRLMRSERRELSPLFTLQEDFRGGEVPRFNDEGELAPEVLSLITNGKLSNSLVSSRTAKEYGVPANGAAGAEQLRSPSVAAGTLAEEEILKKLGTGLHLSNLHYLNWSDQPGGRVTGMTRYACFWVEGGKIVAPIENMRFDDSIFSLMGESLEDLTTSRAYLPQVGTYEMRSPGGIWCPGALLKEMKFTI